MSLYGESAEEALRARAFLKDWASEGLLTDVQYRRMEQETVSGLRTTNIFLRVVLFFFTVIIAGGAAGLFLTTFLSGAASRTTGVFLVVFAVICYAAAEGAASKARLYRFGIEEALVLCSIGFLCAGIYIYLSSNGLMKVDETEFLVGGAGASLSLWIWHRFGLAYAFLFAMMFATHMPSYWSLSRPVQHVLVAGLYTAGLAGVARIRSRHRFGSVDDGCSLVEAFLWLGIYLEINLQISSFDLLSKWLTGSGAASEFPKPFYWTTWVLIWCLPPIVLARGIRRKDRFVIAAGALATVLTLITNKPYLGWPRHTWDPMLLGVSLAACAMFIRRWLARGKDGIRHGFTAARLSGRYKQWVDAGSAAVGLLSPEAITPTPETGSPEFKFGGGDSGGGGASSDF